MRDVLSLFVDRVSISTAAPLIKADLKISNTQLGLAFSAFAIPYALFQLIGGWIGDRLGPRLTLAICCAMVGHLHGAHGRGARDSFRSSACVWRWDSARAPDSPRPRARWPAWTPARNWGFAQGIVHSFGADRQCSDAAAHGGAASCSSSWRGSFVMLGWRACCGLSSGPGIFATIRASILP